MTATETTTGTAPAQGELWGAHARGWAEQELQHRRLYERALHSLGIAEGKAVLDVGCGSGFFCRLAADAGARVTGIDAAETLVEIARERVPVGEFHVGDLQFLPSADDAFDAVTGFNSFQYAADPTAALREAGRVARPGSPVHALVWGRENRTELAARPRWRSGRPARTPSGRPRSRRMLRSARRTAATGSRPSGAT